MGYKNSEIFSNDVGFFGNISYNLKYITRTRNFKYTWPHNNIFNQTYNDDILMQDILRQQVGIDRTFAYENSCEILKNILKCFFIRHKNTNYKLLLKKSMGNNTLKRNTKPVARYILKKYLHKLIFNIIPFSLFGSKDNAIVFEKNLRKILFMESNRNGKYLYYDKCIWQAIDQRCWNLIKKENIGLYKKCRLKKTKLKRNLYVLKILPKRQGSRPIFVKWKIKSKGKHISDYLYTIAKQFIFKHTEINLQVTQTSFNTFHNNWLSTFYTWLSFNKPPVYFVRTDFKDTFGNIDQIKLTHLFKKIRQQNEIISEIYFTFRKRRRKILVQDAFNMLENYITKFVFKHNKYLYRLCNGLCQGGSLSSLLCNLYLSELDVSYFSEFKKDKTGFLARNCDDYLYVTLDQEKATRFLEIIEKGFPDFNMHVNKSKTESNIVNNSQIIVSFGSFQLNIRSFELYGCYESYRDTSIFHHSKFSTLTSPGKIIEKKLLRTCSLKLHKLYFNTEYNTTYSILYNVYQTASLSAARYFAFITRIFTHYNKMFIFNCLWNCSLRISQIVLRKLDPTDDINQMMLQWIVLKAFLIRLQAIKKKCFIKVSDLIYRSLIVLHSCFKEQHLEFIQRFYRIKQSEIFRTIT